MADNNLKNVDLKGRSFLTLMDFTPEEIRYLLDLAHELKAKKKSGMIGETMKGKNIAIIFEKTSTRTRCSFEVGCKDEGGHVTFIDPVSSQFGKKESVEDSAKVLGRMFDGIEYRGFSQELVEDLAKYSGVPVWNGLTDIDHPTQILADMLTVIEKFGTLDVKLMYIGAKNNVFNSLVEFFSKVGQGTLYGFTPLVNDTVCGPEFYEEAVAGGHYVELDPNLSADEVKKYVKDMDILYTDTWLDMEFFNDPAYQERKAELMKKMLPYQLNSDFIGESKAIVLHDMPMHVGFEISEEIEKKHMEHILDQAENRRHAEKAVMYTLLKS